jgi:hypothetical protein
MTNWQLSRGDAGAAAVFCHFFYFVLRAAYEPRSGEDNAMPSGIASVVRATARPPDDANADTLDSPFHHRFKKICRSKAIACDVFPKVTGSFFSLAR